MLVVEDDTAVRRSIRRMLERHGYSVLEAGNGAAAPELRAAHPAIECIVADLMMPPL